MKPTVVQYPQSLSFALSDLARASVRHGRTAYALSLVLALTTLLGSVFYKEIAATFGYQMMGVRALAIWQGVFLIAVMLWLGALALGLLCMPQKGRIRRF